MGADGHLGIQDVFTAGILDYCAGFDKGSPYATLTYARTYHMVTLWGGK